MAETHLQEVREMFERYDSDRDDSLNLNELAMLLQEISSKITALPAVGTIQAMVLSSHLITHHAYYRLHK